MNMLLLRGLAREARQWGDFPALLESTLPSIKTHTIDLPGAGTECHRTSPTSVPAIMEDVRQRWLPIRDANPGPWILFGISFGGMIAMEWIRRHPTDHGRVVIANSSAANAGHPFQRLKPTALKTILRSVRTTNALDRERHILGLISNEPDKREPTAVRWAEFAADRPMKRNLVVRQLFAASRFRVPRGLQRPALVLAAPRDRFVDSICSERIARKLDARIERHPSAGHALALDAPDWIAEKIADWVEA